MSCKLQIRVILAELVCMANDECCFYGYATNSSGFCALYKSDGVYGGNSECDTIIAQTLDKNGIRSIRFDHVRDPPCHARKRVV